MLLGLCLGAQHHTELACLCLGAQHLTQSTIALGDGLSTR